MKNSIAQLIADGLALQKKGRLPEARALYMQALEHQPDHFDALQLLGAVTAQAGDNTQAIEILSKAIAINPGHAGVHFNYGNALMQLGLFAEAVTSYDNAIAIKPRFAEAYNNRGSALETLQRFDAAVASYDNAIAVKADYVEAYCNRGVALEKLRQFEAAAQSYQHAIALAPTHAKAHNGRGHALLELGQTEEAVKSFDRAIAINPDYIAAYYNRGDSRQLLGRFAAAADDYAKVAALEPHREYRVGHHLHAKMRICDWAGADNLLGELTALAERGKNPSTPFPVLAILDAPSLHRKIAESYIREKYPARSELEPIVKRMRREKIRVGYFSADYHNHPVPHLLAELLEHHDRSKFNVVGVSFGPDKNDEMRQRLLGAFDTFVEVRDKSDKEIAALSRELEIDIAVDLGGHTANSRTGIFAHRAAPLQANYLGYPSTIGAGYIDYLIADETLIPTANQKHYAEKIVYLPHSYQPNDRTRVISDAPLQRSAFGLPDRGFVFCCFNASFKITPPTFDGWMRLLNAVEGSVLWLRADNAAAAANLKQEAERRGISGDRLIFAQHVPLAQHFARHRLADLFLDTFPYNAHTTASDALWAGLPVLTLAGQSYVSRVGASLLRAVRLPELVVATQTGYEALAIELAADREALLKIRETLASNRLTTPLFDTPSYARHIEAAYMRMVERYDAGLTPDHIYIQP